MKNNMEVLEFLGKGSFGNVELVKVTDDHGRSQHQAMKTSSSWALDDLKKELRILSKFKGCPGIVRCCSETLDEAIGFFGDKKYRMFLEYAAGGSLGSFMEKRPGGKLPEWMIKTFTRMILVGLSSMHGKGYVHCDLKPDNVLVFPRYVREDGIWSLSYEVKISDLGLAKEPGERDDWWEPDSPFRGTPLYMSPESVRSGKTGSGLDIWSLGCIVLEMYTGQLPWPYQHPEEVKAALGENRRPDIPEHLPATARHFLGVCLEEDPGLRWTANQLLVHPFFRGDEYEPEKFVPKDAMEESTKRDNDQREVNPPPQQQQGKKTNKPLKLKIKLPQLKKTSKPLKLKIKLPELKKTRPLKLRIKLPQLPVN